MSAIFIRMSEWRAARTFYCAGGATPLLSAMLSIRYVLADNAMEEGPLRTLVAQRGDTYLYENAYVLPLGIHDG